ncbi:Gfo/Idh/MocA family protein [Aestuariivirga litoralis]|uniref:Gfo/Idh/MocA family protein n=1 Tax=Aestuariivirga litoralis TaxID=2650924 RepID=UPI0018C80695|nr:Gfo/Idh/MocA family oxidoreductase [Aestuariivirga litoralis]MBG1232385.1 Gfo/Idh/MocA family oxidoreductase [Aestuariivirga litoralis]
MKRIRIGVIGAGGIAQVEHIPNLRRLSEQFEIAGVCDPSASTRQFISHRYGLQTFETIDQLLGQKLDAILVASPDALHKEHALAGFAHGLHVFCEKPLCYAPADIAELIAARDAAGKVLQVGYMKRFDPSYEAALELMPGTKATLRHVSVEVNDPDAWPFIRHHDWQASKDVPDALIADVRTKQKAQVKKAVGIDLNDVTFRGYTGAYCSAIVHDVNAVHGLLKKLGVPDGEISGAQLYAGGDGGHGSVKLLGGQALWTMTHLTVPKLPHYRERITLYFDDASLELEFPSPYLNHQPTQLTIRTGDGHQLHTRDIRKGYEEAFIEELKGFWSAIVEGKPVRNTAEHAHRDMNLLANLTRWNASHPTARLQSGESF